MEKLYTIKEAIELLRISRSTIMRLIQHDLLKTVKITSRRLIPESEIQRLRNGQ